MNFLVTKPTQKTRNPTSTLYCLSKSHFLLKGCVHTLKYFKYMFEIQRILVELYWTNMCSQTGGSRGSRDICAPCCHHGLQTPPSSHRQRLLRSTVDIFWIACSSVIGVYSFPQCFLFCSSLSPFFSVSPTPLTSLFSLSFHSPLFFHPPYSLYPFLSPLSPDSHVFSHPDPFSPLLFLFLVPQLFQHSQSFVLEIVLSFSITFLLQPCLIIFGWYMPLLIYMASYFIFFFSKFLSPRFC